MTSRALAVTLVPVVLTLAQPVPGVAGERPPKAPSPAEVAAARQLTLAPGHPKLDPLLNQLHRAWFGLPGGQSRSTLPDLVAADGRVEVVVEARTGRDGSARAAVLAGGGEVHGRHARLLFARVPLARLPLVADDPAVLRVRVPRRGRPDVTGEGVALHAAAAMHASGITGSGATVAVLDCGGFSGYQALLGSELPAQVTLWTGGSSGDPVGSGVHGKGCAEIVHDMAPGAEMLLAHDGNEQDFYAAVDWIITSGANVVSYSCGWIGPYPFDGSAAPHNPVSAAVEQARAAGVLWVNSAGNYAEGDTYSATYVQLPGYDWHSFDGDWADGFFLWAGQSAHLVLTWNDWPADPQTQGSSQDYNADLWRWDGAAWVVDASSANPQAGVAGQIPFEEIDFTSPVDSWYYVTVSKASATADHDLNLRSFGPGFLHSQPERSVAVPAESPAAVAVGAVHWSSLALEPFSSRGPTLGPGGTLLGGQRKPDLAAADAVSTVTYGPSDGQPWSGGSGFFGTSAACPHVAGAAALVRSAHPAFTADQIEAQLLALAVDMGSAGPDSSYGYGRVLVSPALVFADGLEVAGTSTWSTAVP